MRNLKRLTLLAIIMMSTAVYAEGSYVGIGVGLQFDPGSLNETISKDGLESSVGVPTYTGYSTGGDLTEAVGEPQNVIPAENRLLSLRDSTGVIGVRDNGLMTAGMINVFYEKENDITFWRVGIDYTQKIRGGLTESTIAGGIKWLKVEWDYRRVTVPVHFGMKAKVGEKGSLYFALGAFYYTGGWSVGGHNYGDIPSLILGPANGTTIGATTIKDGTKTISGPMIAESAKFRVSGYGIGAIFGGEYVIKGKNKLFMELEYKNGGTQGKTPVKSAGASNALAPIMYYPIDMGGIVYKIGYKIAL